MEMSVCGKRVAEVNLTRISTPRASLKELMRSKGVLPEYDISSASWLHMIELTYQAADTIDYLVASNLNGTSRELWWGFRLSTSSSSSLYVCRKGS